jgi:hypothetical protein
VVILTVDEKNPKSAGIRGEHGHGQPHSKQQNTLDHDRTLALGRDPDQSEKVRFGERSWNGWMCGLAVAVSLWVWEFFSVRFSMDEEL